MLEARGCIETGPGENIMWYEPTVSEKPLWWSYYGVAQKILFKQIKEFQMHTSTQYLFSPLYSNGR